MAIERAKVNYKPLWKMLIDRDITKQELREKTSIAFIAEVMVMPSP